MGWAAGLVGEDERAADLIRGLSAASLHFEASPSLMLASGGIPETCLAGRDMQGGWLVVGLGLACGRESVRVLSASDWSARLLSNVPGPGESDGHWAAIRWDDRGVKGWTDRVGLRTLYAAQLPGGVAFSTRLDWTARMCGRSEIDWETFGSRWLCANQISCESPVKGIVRIGPGGRFAFGRDGLRLSSRRWMPGSGETGEGTLEEALASCLRHPPEARLALGLSGGLDSRVLLALLRGMGARCAVFTVGSAGDPDADVASRIAGDLGLELRAFVPGIPPAGELMEEGARYAAHSQAAEPLSSFLKLRHYGDLHAAGFLIVDGGLGEIARRQYLNRVLRSRGAVHFPSRGRTLLKGLRLRRGGFFTPETERLMEKGALEQSALQAEELARMKEFGPENKADLFAVWTRFPNFGGHEQVRCDAEAASYTPFAQTRVLEAVFGTPPRARRGGRGVRDIVRRRCPALVQYPLAGNAGVLPFGFPPWGVKILGRFRSAGREQLRRAFLAAAEPAVRDLVRSDKTRWFGAYDYPRLLEAVEGYYGGDRKRARELDWWLAFELWRRGLEG
ncbi:MAG: asparagine synthase-related protein [Bacteroidota bacterium]